MSKSVLLKENHRGPTPQQEPMGFCFSAPWILIRQLHFPQAALVSDVSLVSLQAPCAILRFIGFRRGELKARGTGTRCLKVRPQPME